MLSGGVDSTVICSELKASDCWDEVYSISFNYGQRHRLELRCAERVAAELGVVHREVDLSGLREVFGASSLTSSLDVPKDLHFEDPRQFSTVVPNRNMIFMAVAAGYAMTLKARAVAIGAHSGDHAVYRDCRPEFFEWMRRVFSSLVDERLSIMAPYLTKSKTEIIEKGAKLGAPFGLTWTCYDPQEIDESWPAHCGRCGSCVERIEAFTKAGVVDPARYA